MTFDHVAVPSNDIAASVAWYRQRFGAEVLYQDATWAFLRVGGVKVALVTPTQHPPHVAIRVDESQLATAAFEAGVPIDKHRDGTTGIYLHDPFGNAVELICYPPGKTVYETSGPGAAGGSGDAGSPQIHRT
jgi:catechol 2,3-dioxygenase-like lactoylglutathione lyase family enzyme